MESNIFKTSIDVWGEDFQYMMWHEEVGELMQAISKFKRKPSDKTYENVCEEIADVMIMTEQLSHCVDLDLVNEYKTKKLERFHKRTTKAMKVKKAGQSPAF